MKKHKYSVTKYNLYKLIGEYYYLMSYEVDKVIYLNSVEINMSNVKFGSNNIIDIYDYFHKTPWCSDLLIKYDQVLDLEIKNVKIDVINKVLQETCQNDE